MCAVRRNTGGESGFVRRAWPGSWIDPRRIAGRKTKKNVEYHVESEGQGMENIGPQTRNPAPEESMKRATSAKDMALSDATGFWTLFLPANDSQEYPCPDRYEEENQQIGQWIFLNRIRAVH